VDLREHYQDLQARNAEIVALAVHDPALARQVAELTGAPFPALADPDHAVAEAYGVYNLFGDGIATPSVFIIDTSGQIVWSYVGRNFADRSGVQVSQCPIHRSSGSMV
jgi:peroxiredoxin Q/BCP